MSKISQDAYNNFEVYLGTGKAEEIANKVKNGELSSKEAKEWGEKVKDTFESARGRKDIDPENWSRFEDGWRPD